MIGRESQHDLLGDFAENVYELSCTVMCGYVLSQSDVCYYGEVRLLLDLHMSDMYTAGCYRIRETSKENQRVAGEDFCLKGSVAGCHPV